MCYTKGMHRKTVIDFRALGERYTFTQPIKELKTRDLAEVADLLAQVKNKLYFTRSKLLMYMDYLKVRKI